MKLLFFKAPWCTACCAIEDNVPAYTVHIDCKEDPETPMHYNVVSLPTFVAVNDQDIEIARIQTTNVKMLARWFEALEDTSGQ